MKRILLIWIVTYGVICAQTAGIEDGKYNKYYPPKMELRACAEWEPVQTVVIPFLEPSEKYPFPFWDDIAGLIETTKSIIPVIIFCNDKNFARADLKRRGLTTDNLTFIEIFGLRTPWMRDYGPQSAYTVDGSHVLIDWVYDKPHREDDESSTYLAYHLDMPVYKTILPPHTLFYSGANILTDGLGTAVLNTFYRDLQKPKPETEYNQTFETYFGFKRLIKVDLDFRHLDLFVKLLNEETLLVEDYPVIAVEKQQLSNSILNAIINKKTAFGREFNIIKIPIPEIINQPYHIDNTPSYINSLIINSTVLVPVYDCPTDQTALSVYRNAMPGYQIIGVPAKNICRKLGTIHCVTREIGEDSPVLIVHGPLDNQSPKQNSYSIQAQIFSKTPLQTVTLYWKTENQNTFSQIQMRNTNNIYSAKIPSQVFGSRIFYYIHAKTTNGKNVYKPAPGKAGAWSFKVQSLLPPVAAVLPEIFNIKSSLVNEQPTLAVNFEKVRMSHIIVHSEPMARELIVRLEKGESFEKLAQEYSQDMFTARKGGDAGFFKNGDLLPQLEEIIKQLREGEYNHEPIKTYLGYHIVKRTS